MEPKPKKPLKRRDLGNGHYVMEYADHAAITKHFLEQENKERLHKLMEKLDPVLERLGKT